MEDPSEDNFDLASWREEFVHLRDEINLFEEEYHWYDSLPLNIKDLRYQGALRTLQIQCSEEIYNREIERNEMLATIQMMKREISSLVKKMFDSASNPRLLAHFKSEANKLHEKHASFKQVQGTTFGSLEEEIDDLESFIDRVNIDSYKSPHAVAETAEEYNNEYASNPLTSVRNKKQELENKSTARNAVTVPSTDNTLQKHTPKQKQAHIAKTEDIKYAKSKIDSPKIPEFRPVSSSGDDITESHSNNVLVTQISSNSNPVKGLRVLKKREEQQQSNGMKAYDSTSSNTNANNSRSNNTETNSLSPEEEEREDQRDAQQIRECVRKLSEMIEANGGLNCGWSDSDHRSFLYLLKKYGLNRFQEAYSDDSNAATALSFFSEKQISEHILAYQQLQLLMAQKQIYIDEFKVIQQKIEKRRVRDLQIIKEVRRVKEINSIRGKIEDTTKRAENSLKAFQKAKERYKEIESEGSLFYQKRQVQRQKEVFEAMSKRQNEKQVAFGVESKEKIKMVRKMDQANVSKVEERVQDILEKQHRNRAHSNQSEERILAIQKSMLENFQKLESLRMQSHSKKIDYEYYTPQVNKQVKLRGVNRSIVF